MWLVVPAVSNKTTRRHGCRGLLVPARKPRLRGSFNGGLWGPKESRFEEVSGKIAVKGGSLILYLATTELSESDCSTEESHKRSWLRTYATVYGR